MNPRRHREIALADVPCIVGRIALRGMTNESAPPASDTALPTGESMKCAFPPSGRPSVLRRSGEGHAPANPSLSREASGSDALLSDGVDIDLVNTGLRES